MTLLCLDYEQLNLILFTSQPIHALRELFADMLVHDSDDDPVHEINEYTSGFNVIHSEYIYEPIVSWN